MYSKFNKVVHIITQYSEQLKYTVFIRKNRFISNAHQWWKPINSIPICILIIELTIVRLPYYCMRVNTAILRVRFTKLLYSIKIAGGKVCGADEARRISLPSCMWDLNNHQYPILFEYWKLCCHNIKKLPHLSS